MCESVLRLWLFFHLSFLSFSFLSAAAIDLLLVLLPVLKALRIIKRANFHHGNFTLGFSLIQAAPFRNSSGNWGEFQILTNR